MLLKKFQYSNENGTITKVHVFDFSSLVSVSLQKCSLLCYNLKHGLTYNLATYSEHLKFVFIPFLAEKAKQQILFLSKSQCIVLWFESFWLADGRVLSHLLCGQMLGHPSHFLCQVPDQCKSELFA
jgi:hypothetical protein